MNHTDYWRANSQLKHITPPGETMPEVGLNDVLPKVCTGTVFEFGCGYGRLAKMFDPDAYVGFDVNPVAIAEAKLGNPRHRFTDWWHKEDTFLAHTVLLHIADDDLRDIAPQIKQYPRIVVGEIMGRRWRRPGNPPVFNREVAEYEDIFGLKAEQHKVPYPRYSTHLTILVFQQ